MDAVVDVSRRDEDEGVSGAGDEGEEVRVGDGVDVMEGEFFGDPEAVDEGGEELGVVFWWTVLVVVVVRGGQGMYREG